VSRAVLAGGTEKLPREGLTRIGDVPIVHDDEYFVALARAINESQPDAVFDLSDEPVLDYRTRMQSAAVALSLGVRYEGADFRFDPAPRPRIAAKPSMAIIGTGKRTGKTAIAAFAARTAAAAGHSPVVVAMGRGGPPEPEVLRGDRVAITAVDLIALADEGRHAASDYIEDALLARVPTVGCRRCGGGLAGAVRFSNVPEGVELANGIEGDLILLEGSGAAQPPVDRDVTCLVVPASIKEEFLTGYLGLHRVLIADLVVVSMCESPFADPSQISSVVSHLEQTMELLGDERENKEAPNVVRTVFRPNPTRSVEGAKAFVATTAPEAAGEALRSQLEDVHGCEVIGMSHSLSNRNRLEEDLQGMRGADVLVSEIKAAAVDVAARRALDQNVEVVFFDNEPIGVGGDDVAEAFRNAADLAKLRFE
jgi:cyclic 2,3-diphosphoglycerate synthase